MENKIFETFYKIVSLEYISKSLIIPLIVTSFFHFYNLGYSEFNPLEADLLTKSIKFLHIFSNPSTLPDVFLNGRIPEIVLNSMVIYLFGINETVVRFVFALLGAIAIIPIYMFTEELFDKRIALISSILYSVTCTSIINRSFGGFFVFTSSLFFLFFYKFYKETEPLRCSLYFKYSVFLFMLMLLSFPESILFIPGMMFLMYRKGGLDLIFNKRFYVGLILCFSIIISLVTGVYVSKDPGVFQTIDIITSYCSVWFSWLIGLGVLLSLIYLRKEESLKILLVFVGFYYGYFLIVLGSVYHYISMLWSLIVLSCSGFVILLDYKNKRWLTIFVLIFFIIVSIFSLSRTFSILNGKFENVPLGSPIREGWKNAGYFIRENSNVSDTFLTNANRKVAEIYLGRKSFGEFKEFFNYVKKDQISNVKFIILTKDEYGSAVWNYVKNNYNLTAVVYSDNEASIYIFSKSPGETKIISGDLSYLFDKKYSNLCL